VAAEAGRRGLLGGGAGGGALGGAQLLRQLRRQRLLLRRLEDGQLQLLLRGRLLGARCLDVRL
jgi:hypothetical protein